MSENYLVWGNCPPSENKSDLGSAELLHDHFGSTYCLQRASQIVQWQRIHCQCKRLRFDPLIRKMPWRRKWQPAWGILVWEIPWMEEPGGLQSMGLQRVGDDLLTKWQLCTKHWSTGCVQQGKEHAFQNQTRYFIPSRSSSCVYGSGCAVLSRSVLSDSLRPHGLQTARLLSPWEFPGKNTGVDCHALFMAQAELFN